MDEKRPKQPEELTEEELEEQEGEALPDREAMSVIIPDPSGGPPVIMPPIAPPAD